MNSIANSQSNVSVYTYLTQVQALFSQYIQIKTQLNLLDRNLENSTVAFNTFPTQQNLLSIENSWNQKLLFMRQLPQIVNNIAACLVDATKLVLVSLQMNISANNKIGIVLNDNAISSICSIIEQNIQQLFIKELYRQQCISQNIPMQLSDIEIRARVNQISIPNFDRLKVIINGY